MELEYKQIYLWLFCFTCCYFVQLWSLFTCYARIGFRYIVFKRIDCCRMKIFSKKMRDTHEKCRLVSSPYIFVINKLLFSSFLLFIFQYIIFSYFSCLVPILLPMLYVWKTFHASLLASTSSSSWILYVKKIMNMTVASSLNLREFWEKNASVSLYHCNIVFKCWIDKKCIEGQITGS